LVPKLIEREGPTGLIVTTTSLRLHPENETRMLSLTVTDTREQTAAVFRALANAGSQGLDLSSWRALQAWLATSMCDVEIPFAPDLAKLVPPVAIRLRRDFKTVLTLIRAHALLHQASRRKDAKGRLLAEIADYAAVRELVADLVAEGAEVTIKPEVKETVKAVQDLLDRESKGDSEDDNINSVKQADLRKVLKLDKSVVSRRVAAALDAGLLRNLEDRKGRPARLVLGDPLPDEIELLPTPARLHGCTVDGGDNNTNPSLYSGNGAGQICEQRGSEPSQEGENLPHKPMAGTALAGGRQRQEPKPGEPRSPEWRALGLESHTIAELARWYLGRFEAERKTSDGDADPEAQGRVDAELRAVLADHGVFAEYIEVEFEAVMKVVFSPLGSDAGR
jgi:hypothetical protein